MIIELSNGRRIETYDGARSLVMPTRPLCGERWSELDEEGIRSIRFRASGEHTADGVPIWVAEVCCRLR